VRYARSPPTSPTTCSRRCRSASDFPDSFAPVRITGDEIIGVMRDALDVERLAAGRTCRD